MKEEKILHRNIPQMQVNAICARISVLLWARGTGKSEGGLAPWIMNNAKEMPGSVGAVGTDSYKHLRKQILPEFEKTWGKLGLKKNKDYWIDKFPPKHLGIPEAIRPISEPDNVVFWRNGSATKFFSFNFQALNQGDSIDYLGIEEAKLVNHKRLLETFPAIRGNEDAAWAWKSCHKSIMIVSDMPDDLSGQWMLDYADSMNEPLIRTILKIQGHISLLEDMLENGEIPKQDISYINDQLGILRDKVNSFRKNAVFVSYASTLENLHALGLDVVKNLQTTLNEVKLRRSVLNEIPKKSQNCFYHFLSKEKHGYVSLNEKYLKTTDKTKDDCRWDSDLTSDDLHIAFDYNGKFCSALVAQYDEAKERLRFVKNFYADLFEVKRANQKEGAEQIKILRYLCRKIADYYKHRKQRSITYYYDNTSIGTDADRTEDDTYKAIVEAELQKAKFDVNCVKVSQMTHKQRYELWETIFSQDENSPFSFQYNTENCHEWFWACTHTKTIFKQYTDRAGQRWQKFEKDKSDELKDNVNPVQATHITEAGDILMMGVQQSCTTSNLFVG